MQTIQDIIMQDNNLTQILGLDDKGVIPFATVLKNCRKYYINQEKWIKTELNKLPVVGSVHRRVVYGNIYYYLIYRTENGIFHSDYIGKKEPIDLKNKIERRRYLKKELRKVKTALYGLGLIKRGKSVGLSKRFAVLERDKFTCQYCGRNVKEHKIALVVDHINPQKHGGEDVFENLITSCAECNSGKRAKLMKSVWKQFI